MKKLTIRTIFALATLPTLLINPHIAGAADNPGQTAQTKQTAKASSTVTQQTSQTPQTSQTAQTSDPVAVLAETFIRQFAPHWDVAVLQRWSDPITAKELQSQPRGLEQGKYGFGWAGRLGTIKRIQPLPNLTQLSPRKHRYTFHLDGEKGQGEVSIIMIPTGNTWRVESVGRRILSDEHTLSRETLQDLQQYLLRVFPPIARNWSFNLFKAEFDPAVMTKLGGEEVVRTVFTKMTDPVGPNPTIDVRHIRTGDQGPSPAGPFADFLVPITGKSGRTEATITVRKGNRYMIKGIIIPGCAEVEIKHE